MHWVAPSEKDAATDTLEKRLWTAAEQAGPAPYAGLKSQEFSGGRPQGPVLGLIFLRFAELQFIAQLAWLEKKSGARHSLRRGSRMDDPTAKRNPAGELSIHGVEKTDETDRLCRLNHAVHGLEGGIRHGGNVNSYYDDPHDALNHKPHN